MKTDRDQTIERLLRRSTRTAAPGPDCLDAETLAALSEDGLTRAERDRAETHIADCHRCQALAAGLVRATAGAAPALDQEALPWWRRGGVINWLVPAAAGAAAVALWIAVPGQRVPIPEQSPAQSVDALKAEAPAAPPVESASEPPAQNSSAGPARQRADAPPAAAEGSAPPAESLDAAVSPPADGAAEREEARVGGQRQEAEASGLGRDATAGGAARADQAAALSQRTTSAPTAASFEVRSPESPRALARWPGCFRPVLRRRRFHVDDAGNRRERAADGRQFAGAAGVLARRGRRHRGALRRWRATLAARPVPRDDGPRRCPRRRRPERHRDGRRRTPPEHL